jgi:hypothetical protein
VPVSVRTTPVPCVTGFGVTEASVGPLTVNVTVLLVPPGAVTLTVLAVSPALAVIVKVAVTVVSFTTEIPLTVTPDPDTVTAVAPVRPLPVKVTGTLVPRTPVFGEIELSEGPHNVNVCVVLVPPGVVTLTFLVPSDVVAEIVKVAVSIVEFTTVTALTVTPLPALTVVPVAVKLVPVSVTGTAVARRPVLGATEPSVGCGGETTVNVTVLLVPPGAVTLTVLAVKPAVAAIVNIPVTVVSFTTVTPPTVTPVLETVMAVVPVRPEPVRVTGTLVPRPPDVGVIEVRLGPTTVNVCALLVPLDVVTLMFLAPSVVDDEIVKVVVSVVEFTTVTVPTVTPLPAVTVVPVVVKFVPVSVTGMAAPRRPVLGATEVSVGADGAITVNATGLLVPPGAVTLTVLAESVALDAIVNVPVTVASFTTVMPLTLTPVPDTIIEVVPVSPEPVSMMGRLVPTTPVMGVIDVRTGPCTLKVWKLLGPPSVVTLTFLAPIAAEAEIVNVVVRVVEFTKVTLPTVTPLPDTATEVPVAVKLAPVSVTGKAVPVKPPLGATEVSVGAGGAATVSEKLCTAFEPTPLVAVNVIA